MQYYILTTMSKLNIITEQDKNKTFINLCENIIPFWTTSGEPMLKVLINCQFLAKVPWNHIEITLIDHHLNRYESW